MNIATNFTIQDIVGSTLGCILFLPILLSPGYVVAWFAGLLRFREVTAPWRILISLPLSVAVCPIVTYWAGLRGSWFPVFALYGACFLIWLSLLAGKWGHETLSTWLGEFRSVPRVGWVISAVWLVIAIASLVNVQVGDRLYLGFADYDHVTRAAIIDAISRGGVRPSNPFHFLGSPSPLRYHYFWFLLCSLVSQMGGPLVSSQQAIISSVVWCGWALIALVPLYLRFFQEMSGAALRRCSLVAIGLFSVTGLDILPSARHALLFHSVLPEMEWWNEQVTSWFGALLWVPHHVAALVTCLMGFLLAWDAGRSASLRIRAAGGVVAGVAFATGAGTSIYVTLVFVVFLTVWTSVTLMKRWWNQAAVLVTAGVVSGVLISPYLRSLAGPGAGGSFVQFEVRQFYPLLTIFAGGRLSAMSTVMVRLIVLPLNYFLELGFFGVAAVVYLFGLRHRSGLRRRSRLRPHVAAACIMAAVSVGMCTFLRSGVISANDLGWRGFLPAQFMMLLWAAGLMVHRGDRAERDGKSFNSLWLRSPVWAPLILLGLAGTTYELVLQRTYLMFADPGDVTKNIYAPKDFGARALELRRAYEVLDRRLPPDAKLQASPEWVYFDFYTGLYSRRQLVVADSECGAVFGGDSRGCKAAYADVSAIFDGAPNQSWQDVLAVCRRLSINALIVTDLDGAWARDQSGVSQSRPLISGNHVRVYLTGAASQLSARD